MNEAARHIARVIEWLKRPDWGQYQYMEGSEIYTHRDDALIDLNCATAAIEAAETAAFRRGVEAMRVATWRALDCSGGRDSPTYTSLISGHYPCPCGNGRVPTGAYRMACNVAASAIAALPPPEDGP